MTRLPSVSDLIIGNSYVSKPLSNTSPKPPDLSTHSQQLQLLPYQKKLLSAPVHDFGRYDKQNLSPDSLGPNNLGPNTQLPASSHPNPPWSNSRGPSDTLGDYSSNQRASISSSIASGPLNSPVVPSHFNISSDFPKSSNASFPPRTASNPKDLAEYHTMSNQHPQDHTNPTKHPELPKSSAVGPISCSVRGALSATSASSFSGSYPHLVPNQLPVQPPMLVPHNSLPHKNANMPPNSQPPPPLPADGSQPNHIRISPQMPGINQLAPRESGLPSQNVVHQQRPHASSTVNNNNTLQPPPPQPAAMGQLPGQPHMQTPIAMNRSPNHTPITMNGSPNHTPNQHFVPGPNMNVPRATSHLQNQTPSHLPGQAPPHGPHQPGPGQIPAPAHGQIPGHMTGQLQQIPGAPMIPPNQMISAGGSVVGGLPQPGPGPGQVTQQFLPVSVPYSMDYLQYYPYQYCYPNQVVYHDPNLQQVPFGPGQPMVAPFGQPMGQYYNYPYDENRALINKRRIIKRRTRTGCLTCRKRRIKCDERKPFCFNCERSRKVCLGYENLDKKKKQDGEEDDEEEGNDGTNNENSPSNNDNHIENDSGIKQEDGSAMKSTEQQK